MSKPTIIINHKYLEDKFLQELIRDLPEVFATGKGELIYDGRNKLRRFLLPSGFVVIVKAYKHPNAFQRICYSTFWKNKAVKSFIYAEKLLKMNIDTPSPIAAITYRNNIGLVDNYYFVSTENTNPDCLILRDGHIENPQPLINALASFLIHLHELGFLHGDTNLSNFLYEDRGNGNYHFTVIDINRSRFLDRPTTKEEALKNISRLTHKRELLHDLVSAYAKQRGWNIEETVHKVLGLIISREKNKEFKHKFTHFLK